MQIEVEKVITLYGKRFEQMRDQSLEDANLMYCEGNNAHCVLFLDGKGCDGIPHSFVPIQKSCWPLLFS